MLTDTPLAAVLAAFSDPTPTPGGGSASALAASLGTSLLIMVSRLPKNRAANETEQAILSRAADRLEQLRKRLTDLIDRDADAYDAVMNAYRLPKSTEPEQATRTTRIQAALHSATEAPLDVMRNCAEVIGHSIVVATFGSRSARSDIEVALELLMAGLRGARLNVDTNLDGLADRVYADSVRDEARRLVDEATKDCEQARDGLQT